MRAPDVAFARRERVPDPEPLGYPAVAPESESLDGEDVVPGFRCTLGEIL